MYTAASDGFRRCWHRYEYVTDIGLPLVCGCDIRPGDQEVYNLLAWVATMRNIIYELNMKMEMQMVMLKLAMMKMKN